MGREFGFGGVNRTLPFVSAASFSATRWLPVKSVFLGFALLMISFIVRPGPTMKSTSALGMPQWCSRRSSCSATTDTWGGNTKLRRGRGDNLS